MDDVLLNIFFAYSREDSKLRDRLDKHLSGLKRRKYINTWYDGKIEPGNKWEEEIDFALSKADIIMLLISADFIASEYCFEVEMRKAINRHETGDAIIIPVILQPCDWSDLPFSKIQCLPQSGHPIISDQWTSAELAMSEVAKAIKKIVQNLRTTKSKYLRGINEVINEKDNELRMAINQMEEVQLEQEIILESIEKLEKEKRTNETTIKELNELISQLKEQHLTETEKFKELMRTENIELHKLKKKKVEIIKLISKKKGLENSITDLQKSIGDSKSELKYLRKEIDKLNHELNSKNSLLLKHKLE